MDCDWDDAKNALNRGKHGVDFMDAIAALEDANRVENVESSLEHGEERIDVIGMAHTRILFVVTTMRGDVQNHLGSKGHAA